MPSFAPFRKSPNTSCFHQKPQSDHVKISTEPSDLKAPKENAKSLPENPIRYTPIQFIPRADYVILFHFNLKCQTHIGCLRKNLQRLAVVIVMGNTSMHALGKCRKPLQPFPECTVKRNLKPPLRRVPHQDKLHLPAHGFRLRRCFSSLSAHPIGQNGTPSLMPGLRISL